MTPSFIILLLAPVQREDAAKRPKLDPESDTTVRYIMTLGCSSKSFVVSNLSELAGQLSLRYYSNGSLTL